MTGLGTMQVPAALSSTLAGRYLIERPLGQGGMATVWLARDLRHERAVALKVMRPELAATLGPERFLREIQIAARLAHPHILPLLDSGAAGGSLYYVMPYVAGESLRARLVRDKQLPLAEALDITRAIAGALSYAHAQGVVHRDIKPENILFEAGHAILVDFGIARAVSVAGREPLTATGLAIGTPAYMSPEQGGGQEQVDGRSDIYSLGCVLYEMLVGTPPFAGATAHAVMARHLTDPVPSLRSVRAAIPVPVEAAILRALAKVPADRFATPTEFVDAWSRPVPRVRWGGRRLVIGLIVLVVLGVIGAVVLLARIGRPPPPPRPVRIAVLPYANLGPPLDEYFGDGLAEGISNGLSGIPGIVVIGRQSVLRYKNAPKSPREIGKELGVDYVQGGTIQWDPRGSGRMRITSSLQRTNDNGTSWSASDSAVFADAFTLQANVTEHVLSKLNISLLEPERRARRAPPTRNLEAYKEYLIGRSEWIQRTGGTAIEAAIGHFKRALALDSSFALAYAGLADAWAVYPNYWSHLDSTRNLVPSAALAHTRSEAAARHALALDSTLIEARTALAYVGFMSTLDVRRARAELGAALRLDPNYPWARLALRNVLAAAGRAEEALVQSRRAVELDPLAPLGNAFLAVDLAATGKTTEAMEKLRRAIELNPGFAQAYMILGTLLLQTDQRAAGADSLQRFLELKGYPLAGASLVGAALARRGSVPAAIEVLDRFARTEWEPEPRLAGLYALLGAKERALDVLEAAKARRSGELSFQRFQPFFAALRDEPRFKALWAEFDGR